jgi:hypothetical protein
VEQELLILPIHPNSPPENIMDKVEIAYHNCGSGAVAICLCMEDIHEVIIYSLPKGELCISFAMHIHPTTLVHIVLLCCGETKFYFYNRRYSREVIFYKYAWSSS